MAMRKLLAPAEQPQVNYQFTDIAAGTGYATFYGAVVSGGYILSNNTFYSNSVVTQGSAVTSTAFLQLMDKDFDVLFNKPQNLRGNAIVEVPVGIYSPDNAGGAFEFYIIAKVRKWNGSTETEIASASSPIWIGTVPGAIGYKYNFRTAKVIVPNTHFKSGETLRITIHVYAKDAVLNNKIPLIAHDPMSRGTSDGETYTFGTDPTIFKLQLPLKMES